jgi:phage I-like protein
MLFSLIERLSVDVSQGDLPTEVRLFSFGINKTTKGEFLFDQDSAKTVMSSYTAQGVDIMIDLEHQSMDPAIADPSARDARGWGKLDVRPDGLYLSAITWTPDGAARLSEKRQRYTSPVFSYNPKTKRVEEILNVAITAMPATYEAQALVAASARNRKERLSMNSETVKSALEAIKSGDAAAAVAILEEMIAAAASSSEPTPEPDAAAMSAAADEEAKKKQEAALSHKIFALTGRDTATDAVAELAEWKSSHLELSVEREKLTKDKVALESVERVSLARKSVSSGGLTPGFVWEGGEAGKLRTYLAAMPMQEFRALMVAASTAKPAGQDPLPVGDVAGAGIVHTKLGAVALSEREIAMCTEKKIDTKAYAEAKAAREKKG